MRTLICIACIVASLIGADATVRADDAAKPAGGSPVARRLMEMFTVGFNRQPNSLKESQRLYELARGDAKGDPRVDYAYGLVLLKQLKNKEALTQFQTITRQPDTLYIPAWKALIWLQFVGKEYNTGYDRMKEFSRRLATPPSPIDPIDRQQAAEWLGEVVAALQKSADTVKQREASLREDEAIKELLGPDLQASFTSGKTSVHSLHATMEDDVQQARDHSLARQEKDRADRQTLNAKNLDDSEDKREALKKSAEDAKKYITQQLAEFDKQLARLEKDYEFLQKRSLSISASQLQLNTEMELLTQQTTGNARPAPAVATAYEQRKNAIAVQMLKYQFDMEQTAAAGMVVCNKAQVVVGQRTEAVRQYEKVTGQLLDQDTALSKWQDRLKKDSEKLKKPSTGKTASVTSKMQQARSFRTYVDLDPILERDRLLDSYGVSIPETAAAH